MTSNMKADLRGKWITVLSILAIGYLDSRTTVLMAGSTVLQWGLKNILVCGTMITVLIRFFTSARNHFVVCANYNIRMKYQISIKQSKVKQTEMKKDLFTDANNGTYAEGVCLIIT